MVWYTIGFHTYENIWSSLYTIFISSITFGYVEINFLAWTIERCQENKFVKKINHALVKNWEISSSYIYWRIWKVHDKGYWRCNQTNMIIEQNLFSRISKRKYFSSNLFSYFWCSATWAKYINVLSTLCIFAWKGLDLEFDIKLFNRRFIHNIYTMT